MRKKLLMVLFFCMTSSMLLIGCTNDNLETSINERGEETMGTDSTTIEDEWVLIFEDTFDGETLNPDHWEHAPEWERHHGQWSNEEAFIDGDGQLVIQISERDGKYYSGAIRSRGLFEQVYGYYEIRAKLPQEEGFWTAFWLMSDSVHQVGDEGRDGTEIDIFETPFSNKENIEHALHWDGYENDQKSEGKSIHIPGIYEGFHTFALEWNEDEYIFYVDDEETWRTSAGGVSQVSAYLKITAEVGDWAGDIKKANLPAQMVVDYVRVYEKKK